jgi:hypothetical protein
MDLIYKNTNPKKFLGYMMAFIMVFFTNLAFSQVANDDCANAEPIACGASAIGDNTGATANAPGGGNAIWYSFTGNGNDITVSTCGTTFDTRLYILDACVGGNLVGSNDDGCS